jgi:prefoldin subunit 5
MPDPSWIGLIVQLVVLIITGAWVVMSIRSKTRELAYSIDTLALAIKKLDHSVEKLDEAVRDLDRRVTRLEVRHKTDCDT